MLFRSLYRCRRTLTLKHCWLSSTLWAVMWKQALLGGGHSIGIPLAVSADRSFIAPTATMTIHPVRHSGTVLATGQTMNYLESIQQRVTDFVCENSGISRERFSQLMTQTDNLIMDLGTCVDGKTAVKEGIIDAVGTIGDVLEFLYSEIEKE